ncbi:DUF6415 family natural product biosynthesis protein [Streptomyces canus]|uniref:DUF6415 family natural product biosynthesis protein n=1 Tax=Streptomyces canus TaxID=58343 RepID=UPI0033E329CA
MTAAALSPDSAHPVRTALPCSAKAGPKQVLEKVQRCGPYVDGFLLNDVAAVLDDYTPAGDGGEEHAQRLRGHLMRLVNLAVTTEMDQKDQQIADLVERGRHMRAEELPSDHRRAVGHVRQMAWTLNELLERLVENQCLTEEP